MGRRLREIVRVCGCSGTEGVGGWGWGEVGGCAGEEGGDWVGHVLVLFFSFLCLGFVFCFGKWMYVWILWMWAWAWVWAWAWAWAWAWVVPFLFLD